MAGDDRSVEERLAALERAVRGDDNNEPGLIGRVTYLEMWKDAHAKAMYGGFEALIQRAKLLGWESLLRDLEAAGFEVGERATRYGGATGSD